MLKLANKFHDFKCGEIFCITSTTYRVACCLCGSKVLFGEFPQHFQALHLSALDSNNETVDIIKKEEDDGLQIASMCAQKVELSDDSEIEDEKPIDLADLQKDKGEQNLIVFQDENTAYDIRDDKESPLDDIDNDDDAQTDDLTDSNNDSDYVDTMKKEKHKVGKTTGKLPFACTDCDRAYKSKKSLNWHTQSKHDPNGVKKAIKEKEKKQFPCDQCDASFPTEYNLIRHKYKHSGNVCEICGKQFTEVGNLMRHKIRHTGVRNFKCDICDMSFYTKKEKQGHMMRHTQQLSHICEICGKACRDHGKLREHMRRHTGERPAKCNVCGKCFFSGHDLNVHAVTHTTDRPFSCDICGSTFQLKKALRVHKKVHNNVRNHECKICGKAFAQSGGLHAHMRSHDAAQKSSSIEPNLETVNILKSDVQ